VTQACIGLFMGAFIYVFLVFLVTHKDEHTSFIPQVSLITSWFLVLAAFGFLVFYSHRVAVLIQNPDAIGRIVDDLRRAVKLAAPYSKSNTDLPHLEPSEAHRTMSDSGAMLSPASGYLQEIDHQALVSAAAKAGALISISFRPGQFVLQGETLASVSPASKLPALTPWFRAASRWDVTASYPRIWSSGSLKSSRLPFVPSVQRSTTPSPASPPWTCSERP
jgi:uncharacterized membrane protein